MANRTTKVSLVAEVSSYISGMATAASKTRELGSEAEKLAQKKQAVTELGTAAFAIGAVAAAGVAIAIAKFAEFDQAMSNVKAATQETTANMTLLRAAALDAGAKTVFSATEAANAIEELGKNGLSTADILAGGLNGALSLATAGQLEVGRAAEIASISMKQFGLAGSDIPHISDLLAAGAGKAAGDVEDLAQALAQSGLVAHQTGLTIDETTGILAAFADKGLKGSDAGTSLKTMLQSLTPSSQQAADAFDKLGISAFDSSGQFVGITKFAGLYSDAMHKLTPEVQASTSKIIFGSDAVRASNVLYDLGAKGVKKYIDQTNDAGYAAKVAADRMNNLRGDIEQLGGSIDTAFIQTGSAANATLRDATQTVTGLVNSFSKLPEPVLATVLGIGGVTAALGLTAGAGSMVITRLGSIKVGLEALNISSKTAAIGLGVLGGALTLGVVAIGAFLAEQARSQNSADTFQESLNQTTGAVTNYTRELVAKRLQEQGAFDMAKKYGISQDDLTTAVLKGGDALKQVKRDIQEAAVEQNKGGNRITSATSDYNLLNIQVGKTSEELEKGKKAFENTSAAVDDTTDGLAEIAGTAKDATGDISALADEINNFGKAQLDVNAAQRDFQASIDKVTDSIKDNGQTLDINSEAGRNNQAALDDIAKSALAAASATLTQTGSQEDATAAIQGGRDALIAALAQFGITGPAAEDYANKLGLIPSNVVTAVAVTGTASANEQIDVLIAKIRAIPTSVGLSVTAQGQVSYSDSRNAAGRAEGGAIYGPGTGTSDTAGMYALSNGEHVLTAAEVKAMGGQAAVYSFRQSLHAPTWVPSAPGLANGGAVAGPTSGNKVSATFYLNEVSDQVGTANAVVRRMKALAN